MSGLARVVLMLVGIVAGGDSEALHVGYQHAGGKLLIVFPGHSREGSSELSRASMYIYLPWVRASWHPFRIWAEVGVGELHSGHLLQTL